jgi:hypothetical protein
MELTVLKSKGYDLDIFKKDKKIFYSKLKRSWLKKSIEIFNEVSEKLIEIKYGGFFKPKYEIIFQNEISKLKIESIVNDETLLNNSTKIIRNKELFTFKNKSEYFLDGKKIATSEEKLWVWKRKLIIDLEDLNSELLNVLAIIILTYESEVRVED